MEALTNLLGQIYGPASQNYRHFLTPGQFTEQFGPTPADYQAVIDFAKTNGLTVTGTYSNRMLLDVSGSVANVESAFHVSMQVYQHPKEPRTFFAPNVEPTIDSAIPILAIEGLNNYALPHPCYDLKPAGKISNAQPNSGSGPEGSYAGYDFRDAYAPGVELTGTGQTVGLLEFDGYNPSDITTYKSDYGLPNVQVSNVLVGGDGNEHGNELEVCLDIEMAISMAPGLTNVIVYEGPAGVDVSTGWYDILNEMAEDDSAEQLSSSWVAWSAADPVAEEIFLQMASQGQSFFQASGDLNAYNSSNPYEQQVYDYTGQYEIPFPADSPNITVVGGTTLTTSGPLGSWVSETVWNWEDGAYGSGGGVSTQNAIPTWQLGVDMSAAGGSTTMRNIPDVALTADNVLVYCDGINNNVGGTSCAAPLWAAFTALVNQEAIENGHSQVGFLNPYLYTIGIGTTYSFCFHDITTGNNTVSWSPSDFYAEPGYDLCTGWGTPNGTNLINSLQSWSSSFLNTGSMNAARQGATATLLPNGKVLVAGGWDGVTETYLSSAELYNPTTGTWTLTTNPMNDAREYATATLLPNGEVLVAGGYNSHGPLSSAELYNPAMGTWTLTTNPMNDARELATATLLPNGEVLVAAGNGSGNVYLSSAELYNPATQVWTLTTYTLNTARDLAAATLLPNGEVLVAGGRNGSGALSSAELYNPTTETWTLTSHSMNGIHEQPTATLLPNGNVLVAGGSNGGGGALSSTELYNPTTEVWTLTSSPLNTARYDDTATLLPDGEVLVAGGLTPSGITRSAELYNPATETWTLTGSLNTARALATATLLPNGDVLITGGVTLSSAELYNE